MQNISISRAKTFHNCHLLYNYKYVNKFTPVNTTPIWVTLKGSVLHETFERLLKYENYKEETPTLSYRRADNNVVEEIFQNVLKENNFPLEKVEEFNLKKGINRWLSFKHDFLDKNNHILYSEKEYNENLFGETNTIAILDLMEDLGNNNYIIYDYKTPKSIDISRYKAQLVLYAYVIARVKGIIKDEKDEDYQKVVDHFKLKVFFPLADKINDDYKNLLKEINYTAKDVKETITFLKNTVKEIDNFDFSKSAEVLQTSNPGINCKWCEFAGSSPDTLLISENGYKFQGCPITKFCGMKPLSEKFQTKN